MCKNIVVFIVCVLVINITHSIYTREELTTKPPYTTKTWRRPALQPSELSHQSTTNQNQIIVHHNYSRVLVLKPNDETVFTEIKQIKTNTFAPEKASSSNPDVEEIYTRPQKYSQVTQNWDQTGISDKMNWEETASTNWEGTKLAQNNFNNRGPTGCSSGINCRSGTSLEQTSSNTGTNNKLNWEKSGTKNHQQQVIHRPKGHYILQTNSNQNQNSQNYQQFDTNRRPFKLEYKPQDPYYSNSKKYRNMAFETCPKNSTGPIAYLWSCNQFLNCWKGRGFVQNCAAGTNFNPETLECDFPHKVKCISGAHDQKVKFEKYSNAGDVLSKICGPNFSGLLPHPTDCTKFVNCAHGQTFIQDCGPGTAFNSVIQACDFPDKVGCQINNQAKDNYELQESEIRSFINPNLNYGFEPGDQYLDQNYKDVSLIKVYDSNLLGHGQNCGPNGCPYPAQNVGQNTQHGQNWNSQGQQGWNTHNCHGTNCPPTPQGSGQNNAQNWNNQGQNCQGNNCPPQQPSGQNTWNNQRPTCHGNNCALPQNSGQNTWNNRGQNCQGNNCPPQQPSGQNTGNNQRPNCYGNNCPLPQNSGQNTWNTQDQNCQGDNCPPPQTSGQNTWTNQRPNCYGNNCASPQNNGQDTLNSQGQNCQGDNCPPPQTSGQNTWTNQRPNCYGNNCALPPNNGQNTWISGGQNCQGNNCSPPQIAGQNCQGQNCPPPQTSGQNTWNNQRPNCHGNNCASPQNNGPNCQGNNCSPSQKPGQNCPNCEEPQSGQNFNQQWNGQNQPCTTSDCRNIPQSSQNSGPNCKDPNCIISSQVGQNCGPNNCPTNPCNPTDNNCNSQNTRESHQLNLTTTYWATHPTNTGPNVQYGQNFDQSQQSSTNYGHTHTSAGQNSGYHLHSRPNEHAGSSGRYIQTPRQVSSSQNMPVSNTNSAKCPSGHNGLLPHPTECAKFLNCANGQTFIQNCGPGTVFNPKISACDWPHNVNCPTVDSKRELSSKPGQQIGTNQYYGQNRRNATSYGQNYGQFQGQTSQRNYTRYSPNTGSNFNQNQGQYPGQNSGRNATSYGQNYGQFQGQTSQRNYSRYSPNTGSNFNQNQGQYQGQNSGRTTTSYGQNIGHNYPQTSLRNFTSYQPNIGSNYNQHYSQGREDIQTSSTNFVPQYRPISGAQNGQNAPCQNCGTSQQYKEEPQVAVTNFGTTGQQYPNSGVQLGQSRSCQNCASNVGGKNLSQNYEQQKIENKTGQNGYVGVIGYRRDPPLSYDKSIIEPAEPTELNYTINVSQNPKKTGRHWPPPFPSTDTSADYFFEEVTQPSDVKSKNTWKNSNKCQENEFECSKTECISSGLVCNGKQDCTNGLDEDNCQNYITDFTLIPNSRLYRHEVEKWLNTELDICAKYCLGSKSFDCKSFNYRNESRTCLLCDSNVGLSGALADSYFYDYYEITAKAIDCTNLHKCSNKKCIKHSQICDGNDDCGNREDEKHCSAQSIGYEIRLAGSHRKNEGRVEIKVFNEWGYICDDKFGLRNADVICKELGYKEGALEIKSSSFFAKEIGDNETYYLMDDVQCIGNETSIRDCDFSGWGIHNCMPQEIVGVICKTSKETCPPDHWKCDTTKECLPLQFLCDGVVDCYDRSDEGIQHCQAPIEVRLVNGTSRFEGRVEIRHHGVWGTVCDDDFNDMTAKVVCNSLGFHGSAVAKKEAAFGQGSGQIWLDQLNCFGNESVLEDCIHLNWGEHNCEHSEDAGVVCSQLETSEYEKKSKDSTSIDIFPVKPSLEDTFFEGKCGYRADDIFNGESNENSDIHFRVVKGSVARKGDYPWQATIRVKGVFKSAHWCGAVVISSKYVLTAAHCLVGFTKGSYIIRAGDYNVDEEENTESEAYIEDFFVHDKFRQGGQMNNDIALIKLKGSGLKLTKQIQPICLPNKNTNYRPGLNCTISGFGSTETGKSTSSRVLRAGWVKIQSDETCKMPQVYGDAITNGMFCAGSLDEGVDSCDGDSGGPLACLDNGLFTLYGITSWGQRCGHANKPGVYVKIAEYRDWIDKMIQENS